MTGLEIFANCFLAFVLFCCWAAWFINRAPEQEPQLVCRLPPPYFYQGDLVRLKRDNPYKGCLRAVQVRYVMEVLRGSSWSKIKLRALNNTEGWFDAKYFERYDGISRPYISTTFGKDTKVSRKKRRVERLRASMEAAAEYEEAIAIQEMMK